MAVDVASSIHSRGIASRGNMGTVSHSVAFEMTAFDAMNVSPPRARTPTARFSSPSPSTRISSTCVPRRNSPPNFSTPRTSASTIAPDPPLGNSNIEFGLYQSSNMYPISAAIVPLAGAPLRRKHNISM